LSVNYGPDGTAAVEDTVFFWVIPWKQLLAMGVASVIAVIGLTFYFHRWLERRHLFKLAHAGKLHPDALRELQGPPAPVRARAPAPAAPVRPSVPPHHAAAVPAKAHEPRRRFAFLRRREKHAARPAVYGHAPEHRSLKEVLHKGTHHAPAGNAIDLKKLRERREGATSVAAPLEAPREPKVVTHGHVISLKKRS